MDTKKIIKSLTWDRFEKRMAKDVQSRIKNRDFTIITSNCCGGWIYHMLGMRFDSPTINMWINKKEFCRFASNLPYYLSQELRFYQKETRKCPCALLGDGEDAVSIDFVHYKTKEEAAKKWNERKERIHWDNLFIITCDDIGTTAEDFALLNNVDCKRKVVFTSREHPEIEDSFVLHTMKRYENAARMQIVRHPITGYRSWEREFDYPAWLNGETEFRYKRSFIG